MLQKLHQRLIEPKASTEDSRRREYILNVLLVGIIALTFVFFWVNVVNEVLRGDRYTGVSPIVMFVTMLVFISLLLVSRLKFTRTAAYLFVVLFFLVATYPIYAWGILLPQGVLTYSLVIVMTGVLLGSRVAFRAAGLTFVTILLIKYLERCGSIHFNTEWMHQTGDYNDVLGYGLTFLLVALVSWLSNREIERSLRRARQSEKELRAERNSLEIKVRERTKELEKAQIEKMLELHRFAEFGRFSSTLLHDLANPLTSVSLELEQLANTKYARFVRDARKGIASMERYVDGARRQLRNQSEIKLFDVVTEIERVQSFLEPKAKTAHVVLKFNMKRSMELYGDSIRFNQIIANLIANAIDAYDKTNGEADRRIVVTAKPKNKAVTITVQDNGIGIATTDLGRIFEAFYTTKTSERGSGLGLAITKQAVEEDFKGTITVTSAPSDGTCFTIRLPLA